MALWQLNHIAVGESNQDLLISVQYPTCVERICKCEECDFHYVLLIVHGSNIGFGLTKKLGWSAMTIPNSSMWHHPHECVNVCVSRPRKTLTC